MYVELELPEIPDQTPIFTQYWLKSLFIQSPSTKYQINALTSTYVRLVEAAIIEYQLGATKLREFWNTNSSLNLGAMHRAMSHFETCISNMLRATNCFRRLRRDKNPLSQMLNAEKANFATDAIADRFRTVRNEIHHLEELVMKGKIADGLPFALNPNGPEVPHPTETNQTIKTIDRLVIGTREVLFSELAEWLLEMSNFAEKIADFLPGSFSRSDKE